eukprot:CAMPEP_0198197488 /NCGR_PEP_ID=MMETSP1445-20131203/1092_1 /TAXON_ID=36898 /ORGANISM="Pyramimonas sp., Strain CCMP2087" /LENGTH=301 /DNA_ID=CAMNT_0043866787 /DNA_START=65 /DNA_END=970 /DNA_ORIENTATION=-
MDVTSLKSFKGFHVEQILGDDSLSKHVAVLGRFEGHEGQAIVKVSRRHFATESIPRLLSEETKTVLHFENDVYTKFDATVPADFAEVTIDVTYPATAKHIAKATAQQFVMVKETAEVYAEVTQAYITSLPTAAIQWVYNVLDKKSEVERLILEDPDPEVGFMLHPDLKWDQVHPESLYCLAICHRRDIRSLRDLTSAHLPLLTNMRAKAVATIYEKYGIAEDKLRIFVHYQPTYYHFHVHFVHTSYMGSGTACGQAHLLDDVIENIANVSSDYYQKRTLHFSLGESHPLLQRFRKRKTLAA